MTHLTENGPVTLTTFKRIPCHADYSLNSFFPRTARVWNTLPPEMATDPSLGAFVSRMFKLQ